jgi:hypothetical protein
MLIARNRLEGAQGFQPPSVQSSIVWAQFTILGEQYTPGIHIHL